MKVGYLDFTLHGCVLLVRFYVRYVNREGPGHLSLPFFYFIWTFSEMTNRCSTTANLWGQC